MSEECIICGAPLIYLQEDTLMVCSLCGKQEQSKTKCTNGHYVCSDCHTAGLDSIMEYCLTTNSKDPAEIIETMMSMPFCHMHGPEHHVMVGASLLTAFKNAGGKIDLEPALREMFSRGKSVPGGACGFWGACGAGISTGIFASIISGSTPLQKEAYGFSNLMTSKSLASIGTLGGPRCCKRNSYLAITAASVFVEEHFGVKMDLTKMRCTRMSQNTQCLKTRCPFFE